MNGVLVPHIDQIDQQVMGKSSESDDEVNTSGKTREGIQKALKVIAENSFFYKDLEVRNKVIQIIIVCVRLAL